MSHIRLNKYLSIALYGHCDTRKSGFWITSTYCYYYSVTVNGTTYWGENGCWTTSMFVLLESQHFTMHDGGGGILDLPSTGIGSTGTPDPKPEVDTSGLKDYPEINCIMQNLLKIGRSEVSSAALSETLKRFMGDQKNINLKWVVSDYAPDNISKHGRTTPKTYSIGSNNVGIDILVELNKSFVDQASYLEIGRTIIHEAVHSYLYVSARLPLNKSDEDMGKVLDEYAKVSGMNSAQHNIMALNLVQAIADALESYHKSNPNAYNSFLESQKNNADFLSMKDFYYMQAWVGLEGSSIFKSKNTDSEFRNNMALYNDVAKTLGKNCPFK